MSALTLVRMLCLISPFAAKPLGFVLTRWIPVQDGHHPPAPHLVHQPHYVPLPTTHTTHLHTQMFDVLNTPGLLLSGWPGVGQAHLRDRSTSQDLNIILILINVPHVYPAQLPLTKHKRQVSTLSTTSSPTF